jgi:hypothetical protein
MKCSGCGALETVVVREYKLKGLSDDFIHLCQRCLDLAKKIAKGISISVLFKSPRESNVRSYQQQLDNSPFTHYGIVEDSTTYIFCLKRTSTAGFSLGVNVFWHLMNFIENFANYKYPSNSDADDSSDDADNSYVIPDNNNFVVVPLYIAFSIIT